MSLLPVVAVTLFDESGRVLVAHSRSLERSEATLRESEARCRDFALTSSDWFWETDEKHRFTYLSDHIRAFGQDPQTRIGRTRTDLAVDIVSEPAKWEEHLALLDRHEPFRDFIYKRKIGDDPERVISVGGNPFFDEARRFLGYRGTARDITEKRQLERQLRLFVRCDGRLDRGDRHGPGVRGPLGART